MAIRIQTTVRTAAADIADAGLPDHSRAMVVVLDEEDEARIARLRRAVTDAEATEEIEADRAFAEIRGNLDRRRPRGS